MRLPIQQPKASSLAPKPRKTPRELALLPAHRALAHPFPVAAHLPRGTPHPESCLSLQRSPTRSTPSPAPPPTERRSPTTWTSPTRRAPTCSTSWPSTPRSPPSRSSCARWPPRRARARWACPWRPSALSASPLARPFPELPGPRGPSPSHARLCPPGAVSEVGAGGSASHPGHPAGLPVPAAPHRPPVRAAASSAGPLLLHRLVLQGGGSGPAP